MMSVIANTKNGRDHGCPNRRSTKDNLNASLLSEAGSAILRLNPYPSRAITQVRASPYDVALVDLSLSDMSGVDVLNRAKAIRPEMAVLIVSGYPEDQYAINLLKAGASGFVAKDAPSENLVSAVVAAAQGRRYVSPRIADKLAQGLAGPAADQPSHTQLSEREFQIFCKLASGQSVSEIAKELFLSVKTVSTYRSRILEKMSFKSNADITYYAVKNQLIA